MASWSHSAAKLSLVAVGLLAFVQAGCSNRGGRDSSKARAHDDNLASESLTSAVSMLKIDAAGDPCIEKYAAAMTEIASEIDKRSDQIAAPATAQLSLPENFAKTVKAGQLYVLELNDAANVPPGWSVRKKSWSALWADYQKIKETPVDQEWFYLNGDVRSLLSDERDRVAYPVTYATGRLQLPLLRQARDAVRVCVTDSSCATINFDDEVQKYVNTVPAYWLAQKNINEAGDAAQARRALIKFNALIADDDEFLSFEIHRNVKRTGEAALTVDLDAGEFAEGKDLLAKMIENIWQSPELVVKINWTSKTLNPNAYTLKFNHDVGARASTSTKHQWVSLSSYVSNKTLAHEFGHVLGFPDYYYTTFDSLTCDYSVEYRADEIMSSSQTGAPTPDDWQTLRAMYPHVQ